MGFPDVLIFLENRDFSPFLLFSKSCFYFSNLITECTFFFIFFILPQSYLPANLVGERRGAKLMAFFFRCSDSSFYLSELSFAIIFIFPNYYFS